MDLQGNGWSYRVDNVGVSDNDYDPPSLCCKWQAIGSNLSQKLDEFEIQDKGEVPNVVCTNGRSTNGRREENRGTREEKR